MSKTRHLSGKSVTILDLDFNPCSYDFKWEVGQKLFLCLATFDEIVCDEKWVNYALKKLKVIVLSESKKLYDNSSCPMIFFAYQASSLEKLIA